MAVVFTVQVTLGYLLMLAAMTYQVELFAAVMLGLGAGHFAVRFKIEPKILASLPPLLLCRCASRPVLL